MQFAVIDTNRDPMEPDRGRGMGFVQALSGWVLGKDYQFIRHDQVATRLADLAESRGLVLSGSAFDFALPDGRFDRETCGKMAPEFRLVSGFHGPVLGICFGRQFHHETGMDSRAGETSRHRAAVEDGCALIRDFVGYCLRRGG